MKILCQNNMDYMIFRNVVDNLRTVYDVKGLTDMSHVAKALNDVQPNLLLIETKEINGIVAAYCKKNNVKIIGFGDGEGADVTFNKQSDVLRPSIETIAYKDDSVEKFGISVFVNDERHKFMAEFLAKNYNVRVFGSVKIDSPKYLGIPNAMEKYEIINSSKFIVDLGSYELYDAILLDTYPLVYTNHPLAEEYTTFDSFISLVECWDYINNDANTKELNDKLLSLKQEFLVNNSTTFTIQLLNTLGFAKEAAEIHTKLGENIIDWISY